jgi:hypothetical protein
MSTMATNDGMAKVVGNRFVYSEPARSRAELRRRIDEIWERRFELEIDPPPRLQELVDSQEEFFQRLEKNLGRPLRFRRR